MREIIYISIILLILSCEKNTSEIRYYPTDRDFSNKHSIVIGLDTTKLNFKQITDKVGGRNYGKLVLEFNDDKIKKRVIPYKYDNGYLRYKNVLPIKSDSILIDGGYSINQLKRILKRHYLNKGKIPFYPDSPKKAIIEITIDTSKNGKELKKVLTKLTR